MKKSCCFYFELCFCLSSKYYCFICLLEKNQGYFIWTSQLIFIIVGSCCFFSFLVLLMRKSVVLQQYYLWENMIWFFRSLFFYTHIMPMTYNLLHSVNIFRWNRLLSRRFWRPALHRNWFQRRPTRNRLLGPGLRSSWLPW